MSSLPSSHGLLKYVNTPGFIEAWQHYVADLIKTKQASMESAKLHDPIVFDILAEIKLLKRFYGLADRVRSDMAAYEASKKDKLV